MLMTFRARCVAYVSFILFFFHAFQAEAGSRTSNGGDIVLTQINGMEYYSAFSLDLIEYALEQKIYLYKPNADEELLPGYRVFNKTCVESADPDSCTIWFRDTDDRSTTRRLYAKKLIGNHLLNDAPIDIRFVMRSAKLFDAGLIDLLYEIRKTSPVYADAILEKIESLTWIFVGSRLEPVTDEDSPISTKLMFQIARNDDNEVRISTEGWLEIIRRANENRTDKYNWSQYLDHTNKMAVIFHEALYAITKDQGDTTSRRARKANAHLFMGSPEMIQKSYRIMFPGGIN